MIWFHQQSRRLVFFESAESGSLVCQHPFEIASDPPPPVRHRKVFRCWLPRVVLFTLLHSVWFEWFFLKFQAPMMNNEDEPQRENISMPTSWMFCWRYCSWRSFVLLLKLTLPSTRSPRTSFVLSVLLCGGLFSSRWLNDSILFCPTFFFLPKMYLESKDIKTKRWETNRLFSETVQEAFIQTFIWFSWH